MIRLICATLLADGNSSSNAGGMVCLIVGGLIVLSIVMAFLDKPIRCARCGFRFLEYADRLRKLVEMVAKDPEWGELLRSGRIDVVKQRLDDVNPAAHTGPARPPYCATGWQAGIARARAWP